MTSVETGAAAAVPAGAALAAGVTGGRQRIGDREKCLMLPPQRIDEVGREAASFCLISLTFATIAAAF